MKSIRNKAKGFTLVELLAVIVILALIMGIAVFSIGNVINSSKTNTKNSSISAILEATKVAAVSENVNLPATFQVYTSGVIALSSNDSIKVSYDKEKVIGGKIHIDINGKVTALGVRFEDGHICTMASGENGCGKMSARNKILNANVSTLKDDSLIAGRKIFVGGTVNNYIKIKENGTEQDYRIVSLEADGTLQLIRNGRLTPSNRDWGYAYDTDSTTAGRLNNRNTYCKLYGDSYYGCNAWQAINGIYTTNNDNNKEGSVTTDSELKQMLDTTYYQTLDSKVKDNMVSMIVNITPLAWNSTYESIHTQQNNTPKYSVQNKVMLLGLRDWYLASGNTYGESKTCTPAASGDGSAACSGNNYLFTNEGSYKWWTMNVTAGLIYGAYSVSETGTTGYYGVIDGGGVRPVFYLSNGVELSGTGTSTDPYRII